MLPVTVTRRVDTIPEASRSGKRINGLFRLMETPDLWLQAYQKIGIVSEYLFLEELELTIKRL